VMAITITDLLVSLCKTRCRARNTDAPYRSGPSKTWIKIKNPKAPAATRAADGTF
jgi:hypothetical protein